MPDDPVNKMLGFTDTTSNDGVFSGSCAKAARVTKKATIRRALSMTHLLHSGIEGRKVALQAKDFFFQSDNDGVTFGGHSGGL